MPVGTTTVTIKTIDNNGFIDGANETSGITISGTSTDTVTGGLTGQTIHVTLNGQSYTGTIASNGTWSVKVGSAALAGLTDEQVYTVTASATDKSGNSATTASSVTVDEKAAISINAIDGANFINASQVASGITINGTSSDSILANLAGQLISVTLNGKSYTALIQSNGNWSVNVGAADLSALTNGKTYTVTATATDAAGNKASTTDKVIVDTTATLAIKPIDTNSFINGKNAAAGITINGTSSGGVGSGDFAGGTVQVALNGQTFTGTIASNGTWSVTVGSGAIAGLTDGQTYAVTASATDNGGNSATTTSSVTVDEGASISISPIDGANFINASQAASGITINGTSSDSILANLSGQTITVTLNGKSYTALIQSNGNWSVNVGAADLGTLSNGKTYTVTAAATDAAGNKASATDKVTVDKTVTLSVNPVDGNGFVDGANLGGITITGNATEATQANLTGQTITVALNGKTYTGTVASNGTWSVNVGAAGLAGLTDGQSYVLTASTTDKKGNAAAVATNLTADEKASISISPIDASNLLNASQVAGGITIGGTSSDSILANLVGQTVNVTLNGHTYTGTVHNDGTWSVNVAAATLAALTDGQSYSVTAGVTDKAGNTASTNTSVTTDEKAALTINPIDGNGSINAANIANGITITGGSGDSVAPALVGQMVTVALNGQNYTGAIHNDGSWSVNVGAAALAALINGQVYDVTASVTDLAGNNAAASEQVSVATVGAPSAATSTLTATPGSVTADGVSTTALTVTVEDASGNAVAGTAVTLSASGGGNTFGTISGVTNAQGVFTTTLASTVAQSETITAAEGAVQETTGVAFAPGPASSPNSSLTVNPVTVTADGVSSATLTLTVKDAQGNPLIGASVALSASGSANTFTPASGVTDANGVFVASDTSTLAQVETITATVGSLQETALVTFNPGTVSAARSMLVASPGSVTADGVSTTALTVTVEDAQGNPVAGQTVTLSGTGAGDAFGAYLGTTNAQGVFRTTLTSTTATVDTITATEGAAQESTVVAFTSDPTLSINAVDGNGVINASNVADGITITGTSSDSVPNDLVNQTVTVSLNGQNYSGLIQSDGTWSVNVGAAALAALTDGQAYTASASVTDKAGNTATVNKSVTADETASLSIIAIDGNGYINAGQVVGGISVAGTSSDSILANLAGQTVTLTLNGQSYTGTVQNDGTWSVNVGAAALAALTDGQSYTASASVTDKAGNIASANASVTTDENAALTVNPIDGNGSINVGNAANGVTITGTSSDSILTNLVGQTVTVTLNGQSYTGTIQNDGTWSVNVGAAALAALTDGQSYSVSASATDKAGNVTIGTNNLTIIGERYIWAGPIAGSWDVAGNWDDTTAGQNPASVAPGSNDSVTINGAAGSAVQVISGTGDSAALTINGATSLAGSFTTGTLTANNALTVNTGDALTVTGNAAINSTLTLDGALSAGSLTTGFDTQFNIAGGMLTTGSLTTGSDTRFNIAGGMLTIGSLTASASDFLLNSGATLSVTGNVTDTSLSQYNINDSTFTVGGTFASSNDHVNAQNGSQVQLAELAASGIYLNADGSSSVEVGTAGGAAAGSITIDSGVTTTVAGGDFNAPSIVDDGTVIIAAGSSFALYYSSLSGTGQIEIGSGATLSIGSYYGTAAAAVASAPTISFEGTSDTLSLQASSFDASQQFTPTLTGFNANDVIDYQGIVTSAVYDSTGANTGILTLYDNSAVVGSLNLGGNYSSDTFYAAAVSSGVTQIGELGTGDTPTAPAGTGSADNYVWAGPIAGSWDVAGNWDDTTAGQNPASVAPGSNDSVTINGAAGSAVQVISGTGDSAALTINGATSLAGSFTTGTLTANNALTVNTGDALTVTGNAAINSTLTLDGALSAGSLTTGFDTQFNIAGGMLTTGSLTTGSDTRFNIAGGMLTIGSLTASASDFLLNSGATLSVTGNVTDTSLSQYNINDSTFTVGGTFASSNDHVNAQNGSQVQLAELAASGIYLNADGSSSVEVGTAGGAAAGSITIDSGVTTTVAGGDFNAPSIVDDGTVIIAAGSSFALYYSSLSGTGQIEIGSGATLSIGSYYGTAAAAVASAPTISFEGTSDTLSLQASSFDASQQFTPTLTGFNANDVIDYQGIVTSAVYDSTGANTGILTLYDNSAVVGSLNLGGNYSSDTFYAAAVSSGVTQIGELGTGDTPTAPAGTGSADNYVWAGPIAGSWDVAGNWDDTTAGQNPASVAPGSNDSVTINGAAGSAVQVISGTGDSAALTINGATSLAGSFTTGTLTANNALTVNTGDALTVTGNAAINSTLTLDGALSAGSLTTGFDTQFNIAGGMLTTGSLTTGSDTRFNIAGGMLTIGSLTASASDFLLNSGATLSVTGNVTDTSLSQYNINDSTFTVGGTFASSNDHVNAQNGSQVQLAELAASGIYLNADGSSSVEVGTAGGAAAGSITIDSGVTTTVAGGDFNAPSIVDDGTVIIAAGSSFALYYSSLSGTGQIEIGSGATLSIGSYYGTAAAAVASAPTISFEGTSDTLSLQASSFDASQQFTPTLTGFNANDVIDYQGIVTSAVYNSTGANTGTLTLYDNSAVVGSLNLAGNYSGDTFTTASIGSGVTQIVDPPAPTQNVSAGANLTLQLSGNETITSGGQDTFVANVGFGQDTIKNFNPSTDVIQFNHTLFANYAAVMGATTQVGANAVITFDKNDTITLANVSANSLTQNNFHIA